jgi:hypothetical protein
VQTLIHSKIQGVDMKPSIFLAAATLSIAGWAGAAAPAAPAPAGAPDAVRVKAAHDLLLSMQAEKLLRMTAGMSKFPARPSAS